MIVKILLGLGALLVCLLALAAMLTLRFDIPRDRIVAEYRAPDSMFLTLADGSILHVRDSGPRDAPALLLLHGIGSSSYAWDGWASALSDRYRVLRLDLAGHGLTRIAPGRALAMGEQSALIDAMLNQLRIEKIVIGGNSLGGGLAWRYAAQRPERVAALIVVDAGGPFPDGLRQRMGRRAALARNPVARLAARWVSGSLVWRQALESGVANKRLITPALVRRADRLWRAEGNRETVLRLASGGFPTADADPAAIRAPALVLEGEQDRFVPPAAAKALADAIPGARFILYPELGHTPHEEAPAQTAADVRTFLEQALR
ncbi:MAG: alpha/beta fold hydrolase [Hyphomonadaceae bacterium]